MIDFTKLTVVSIAKEIKENFISPKLPLKITYVCLIH